MALDDLKDPSESVARLRQMSEWVVVFFLSIVVGGILAAVYQVLPYSVELLNPDNPIGAVIWVVLGLVVTLIWVIPLMFRLRQEF